MSAANSELSDTAITAWARLLGVAQTLLAAVERDLKRDGFPPLSWYDALLELQRAGEPGLRQVELQEAMLLAQYNVSRLADRLVKESYVSRSPCREDARGHVLSITPAGHALLRRMWPAYRAAVRRHFADRIGLTDMESLATILGALAPFNLRP